MEPELAEQAVYSEYEDNIQIADADDMAQWCQWVMAVAERFALPTPAADAWLCLIREAVRYTGDQKRCHSARSGSANSCVKWAW